jgi:hypothetical protein
LSFMLLRVLLLSSLLASLVWAVPAKNATICVNKERLPAYGARRGHAPGRADLTFCTRCVAAAQQLEPAACASGGSRRATHALLASQISR